MKDEKREMKDEKSEMKDNPYMYRTQSRDTSIEAELRQIERIRQMSVARRGQMMFDMISTMRRLSLRGLRLAHPNLSESDLKELWLRLTYSATAADYQPMTHGSK